MPRSSRLDANGLVYALLYRRVSGAEHQKEGLSLQAQEKTTRSYAARPGWVIAGEFEDIMTGKRADRPGYQRMLEQVRQLRRSGKRAAVVIIRLDRLGRNKAEYFRAEAELDKLGAQVHSIKDGGVLDPTHAGILAVFAADEARRIGERVGETRSHLVNQGWHYGRTPFGYTKRPATPSEAQALGRKIVMQPEPTHAQVVRAAYERFAAGESIERVAKWLASLPSEQRGGRLWPSQCTAALLRSPSYVARPAEGDDDVLARPVARWQPIVSDELYARAQARFLGHARRPHQASGRFLLTGFARCPRCGERMVAQSSRPHDRAVRRSSYRCTAWTRGANAGAGPTAGRCRYAVPMARADAAVTEQVAAVLDSLAALDQRTLQERLQRAYDAQQAHGADGRQQRTLLKAERQIREAQARLGKAAIALMDGTLDQDGYAALRDLVTAELARAEETQRRVLSTAPTSRTTHADGSAHDMRQVADLLAQAGSWARLFRESDMPARRAVLDRLVVRASVVRNGYRAYAADVTWSPAGELLRAASQSLTSSSVQP